MVLELTILFLFPHSTGDGAVRAGTPAITVSSFMSKAYVCMDTLCKWMGVRRPGITFMVIIVLSRSLFGFSHKILWKNSNEIFGQPNTMETVTDFFFFFFWAPKSLQMVTAAMKLKDACSLEEKL